MKISHYIKYSLMVLMLAGTFACTTDEETVIIPKTLEEYKQELYDYASSQLDVVNNCVLGYNKGDFRLTNSYDSYTANYRTVLEAALLTLEKEDLTIADIVNANKSLATPGKAFINATFISDRRPVHELILTCEALNSATEEGAAAGQASAEAKATFATAIVDAKKVRDAITTVDRQVTEGVEILNKAKADFEAAIVK